MATDCTVCGEPIPRGRLEALPGVTTCVEHSEAVGYTEDSVELDGADQAELQRSAFTPERGK